MSDATETPPAAPAEAGSVTHEEILAALKDRVGWEEKIALWDRMRHEGVRRANKPWPHAADMHFPLADMVIEKLKPFYFQQVYAGELIADFNATSAEASAVAAVAARWFDSRIKHASNFEDVLPILTDALCQNGRAVARVLWDAKGRRLRFEVPRPQDVIVPAATRCIEEADWIVLNQVWSVAAYKRAGLFKSDEDTLAKIRGGREDADTTGQRAETLRRAGITYGETKDEIVVWVIHERNGDGWRVRTVSPQAPEIALREPMRLAYECGDFKRGAPPFVQFSFEKKTELFLGARGVTEKVAPFEQSLNHDWNTIKDHQSISTKPVLYAPTGLKNSANIRFRPGDILPFQVEKVDFGTVPPDLRLGMAETRQVAEQMIGTPDFGMGGMKQPGGKKTATEVQAISGVMGQTVELRARVFRRELARLLRLAWALLCQYAKEERDYRYRDELDRVPEAVFADPDAYHIEPSASGDAFTREARKNSAAARFQLLRGDPLIRQERLYADFLEADDPALVKALVLPSDLAAAGQMEDQAQELSVMLLGFPAAVQPTDDHAAHLRCLQGYVARRIALRDSLTAEQTLLMTAHAEQHAQALAARDKRAVGEFAPFLQQLGKIAELAREAMRQGAAAPPAGGAAMPEAPPPDPAPAL